MYNYQEQKKADAKISLISEQASTNRVMQILNLLWRHEIWTFKQSTFELKTIPLELCRCFKAVFP